jgi:hypothetical protein
VESRTALVEHWDGTLEVLYWDAMQTQKMALAAQVGTFGSRLVVARTDSTIRNSVESQKAVT